MTELIADIGSNWLSLDDCLTGIKLAADCGADVAKFQLYTHDDLYGYPGPALPGQLPREWIPILHECARVNQIEFMCTPFSVAGVEFLDPYVQRWKVASSNALDWLLLEAIKRTNKRVIVSVGAKTLSEASRVKKFMGATHLTLLYCVADYTTPEKHTNLYYIDQLRESLGVSVGFSDHTKDIDYLPIAAATLHSATIIEKHFTPIPTFETPDSRHSLNVDQLALLRMRLDDNAPMRELAPTQGEIDMVTMHNVRIIAKRDIVAGEEMSHFTNLRIARSKKPDFKGIKPFDWIASRIETAAVNIPQGSPIHEDMLVAGVPAAQ